MLLPFLVSAKGLGGHALCIDFVQRLLLVSSVVLLWPAFEERRRCCKAYCTAFDAYDRHQSTDPRLRAFHDKMARFVRLLLCNGWYQILDCKGRDRMCVLSRHRG